MPETVWVAGRVTGYHGDDPMDVSWELLGIFSSEERAVAACTDTACFVGEIPVDKPKADTSTEWPGAYYPLPRVGA